MSQMITDFTSKRIWFLFLVVAVIGSFVAVLSQELILLIAVLLVGLPFALLVFSDSIRPTAVILLLVFVPLTSILKAVTGSRFAPLTFDLALLLAFLLFIGKGIVRYKIRLGWLDFLSALFFMWALLEMFNPNVPSLQAGFEGLRKFSFAIILFYVGRHFLHTKDIIFFKKSLVVISTLIALYGLKQFFFMSAIDYRMIELASASPITYLMGGWVRPFSTLPGPFHLGLYLVIINLLLISQWMLKQGKLSTRLWFIPIVILNLAVLFFTRTKGNWFGFVAGLVILVVLQTRRPLKLFIRLTSLATIMIVIATLVFAIVPRNRFGVLEDAIIAVSNPWEAPTFVYRVQLWQEIIVPALQESPLLGYGTSSAGEGLFNLYQGTGSKHFPSHNLYLKVFLEMGLAGLFLFLIIIMGSLWQGWRSVRHGHNAESIAILTMYWGIATVVAFLVAGLVIPTLDAYPTNYYFWLLLGLVSSAEFSRPKALVNLSMSELANKAEPTAPISHIP